MAISTLPANQAKLTFQVAGQSYPVISMVGVEAISAGFSYSIEALCASGAPIDSLIKNKAQLNITGQDGTLRNVYGVIIKVEGNGEYNKDLSRIKITLASHLNLLKNSRDTRIILGLSVVEIIKQTCERNSIAAHQIKFSLSQAYPAKAFILQADETDWDFIQRLMSHAGIYCYSSVNEDPERANFETIVFTDNNTYCPYIVRNVLQYIPRSNQSETIYGKAVVGIYQLSASYKQTADRFTIHDRSQDIPEVQILATTDTASYKEKQQQRASRQKNKTNSQKNKTNSSSREHRKAESPKYIEPKPIEQTRFGLGTTSIEQAEQFATFCAEHAQVQSFSLNTKSNVVDMAAGYVCSIDASNFNQNNSNPNFSSQNYSSQNYSGDYLITQVTHSANQGAAFNLDDALIAYRSEAKCILRTTQYRGGLVDHPETPMTFTARVEANGDYAQLDEQGRYKVRPHFDEADENRSHDKDQDNKLKKSSREHTQASTPLRRMQSFGGGRTQDQLATGWHAPLQDDAEVLLSCLNGDPNQPIIVGTLPNPDNRSPVTSANRTQNIIRTQSGNELCMDDKKDHEAITLSTFNGENILHLDANAMGHKIRLATEHGSMYLFAKKTITTKTNDNLIERSGNNRTEIVENAYKLKTNKKEIHHQAKTDIKLTAHLNIKTTSKKNTEFKAGKDLKINVQENAKLTIKGSKGLSITVQNNDVIIHAAKDINIKGQGGGDITFEQSGGGFKIDSAGIVNLYGNNVSIAGSPVNLNGNVSYNIGTPNISAEVSTEAPLAFTGIKNLIDDKAKQVIGLAWGSRQVKVGEKIKAQFMVKNFAGGETATITIVEYDMDGSQSKVDTLTTTLEDGTGHYSLEWQRTLEDAEKDFEEDEKSEDLNPLEYKFEVEIDGIKSLEPSNPLWLTRPLEITVEPDDKQAPPTPDGTIVKIKTADGHSQYAETKNQIAYFENVIIGPLREIQVVDYQHRIDDTEQG